MQLPMFPANDNAERIELRESMLSAYIAHIRWLRVHYPHNSTAYYEQRVSTLETIIDSLRAELDESE
jgi:hypothetical protein